MSIHGPRTFQQLTKEEALEKACQAGDLKQVKTLYDNSIQAGQRFECFNIACRLGHLDIIKFLHAKTIASTNAKSSVYVVEHAHLVMGLYETARYGKFLAARWILNCPEFNATQEQMMTAITTASAHKHWAILKELMINSKTYIDGHYQKPSFDPDTSKQDIILIRSFDNLSLCESVLVPQKSFIPSAVKDKKAIEKVIGANENKGRTQLKKTHF